MDGTIMTLMILGAITVVFFIAQLILCVKAKKTAVKLIPAYIFFLCLLLAGLIYAGAFGSLIRSGFISTETIYASLLLIVGAAAFTGVLLAWGAYFAIKNIKKRAVK